MKVRRTYLLAAALLALAVSASATTVVVPQNTVVPVTMDTSISSATSKAGDTFGAYHEGANGGGFADHTQFIGKVSSVTKAAADKPGQLGVEFVSVQLPDGRSLPIMGKLTGLDDRSVTVDPNTGRLVGTMEARKASNKFIAYGAGAGLVVGQLLGKRPFLGAILGAAAGYLYGQKQVKPAVGRDVTVPAGLKFGVLLGQDVALSEVVAPAVGGVVAGPGIAPTWTVEFTTLKPVMGATDVMFPFRYVMDRIQIPFDYDTTTKTIRVNSDSAQTLHTVGTRIVYVDRNAVKLDDASRIINGTVYVPAAYIEILTNKSVYWNPKSGVLRIE